ncbi:MAG: ureidoglycolate lyase [Rhodocyclaceae bacterium]|nr:ureidoglycolate lyase [Rhodocyclaceae bacterium]
MIELPVVPLSAEAFAPFGQVIEAGPAAERRIINGGNTERFHDLARLDPGPEGRAIVSIFRGQPRALPFVMSMMEHHPLGSQAFMPLSGRPYLVAVAMPGETVRAEDIRVFLASARQGVNYAAGTWHHPLLALDGVSDFLVIDRAGGGDNCVEQALDEPARITLQT